MRSATLTFKSIRARPVVLKLKRSVIARIATITDWPGTIGLFTNEGDGCAWESDDASAIVARAI